MAWLVLGVIYIKKTGCCVLLLHAGSLKMMAEVTTEHAIRHGDIIYPVRDALYLINNDANQSVKIDNASAFSPTLWRFFKRLA